MNDRGVGLVVIRRQLKRRYVLAFFQKLPSCLIGMEACASAHHWSRELQALGHTGPMPPAYMVPGDRLSFLIETGGYAVEEIGEEPAPGVIAVTEI